MLASFEILKFNMNFWGAIKTDAPTNFIDFFSTCTKEKYIYNVPIYEMVVIRVQLLLPVFMDIHCNI